MAAARSLQHVGRQPLPRRDPDLPRDEVEPGDELGDAVLDLEARVHLEEVVAAVGVEQELDGGGVVEVDRAGDPPRALEQRLADRVVDRRRRRLLDQLLVPALDRAVPLAEHRQAAMPVAEQLDLDVARRRDEPLDVDRAVAEGRLPPRAAPRPSHGRSSSGASTRRMPRPPPPAAALSMTG